MPTSLKQAIQVALSGYAPAALRGAGEALTASYRAPKSPGHLHQQSNLDRAAYLLTRFPATYAAVRATLKELPPATNIFSLLDLGAGPGTVLWAVSEVFPMLKKATLLEADQEFIQVGQSLSQCAQHPAVRGALWQEADLRAGQSYQPHDLVTISYALNEIVANTQSLLIQSAWAATTQYLAIIEPGTKQGFANILFARELLLSLGANILAPCPHADACPMMAQGDWCHFAQRLERTAQHRRAKSGELGYEDEKFSYFIASRAPHTPAPARILRHPLKLKGTVKLMLCASEGLKQEVVTAKTKGSYKAARKARWGNSWQ